jgi:hypothetical protein
MAASAVSAHEQEHVQHNQQKAESEGMTATSTVVLYTAICPECGKSYVSGGTTTTTYSRKQQIAEIGEQSKGTLLDTLV